MDQSIKCFCDASFNSSLKVGVVGWKVGNNQAQTQVLTNSTSNKCECIGILNVLHEINKTYTPNDSTSFVVYTDYLPGINVITNKINHDSANRKKSHLQIYEDVVKLLEIIPHKISFEYVQGHLAKKNRTPTDQVFSEIDRLTRKQLRSYVKTQLIPT